jgi:hypothetical protein
MSDTGPLHSLLQMLGEGWQCKAALLRPKIGVQYYGWRFSHGDAYFTVSYLELNRSTQNKRSHLAGKMKHEVAAGRTGELATGWR